MKDNLTFEDGIILCKHVYQSGREKTLNCLLEQEQIFHKTHEILSKLGYNLKSERLDELLYLLNIKKVYLVL